MSNRLVTDPRPPTDRNSSLRALAWSCSAPLRAVVFGWLACTMTFAESDEARAEVSSPLPQALEAAIVRAALPQLSHPGIAEHRAALAGFYASRAHRPAWFADAQPQPDVAVAL